MKTKNSMINSDNNPTMQKGNSIDMESLIVRVKEEDAKNLFMTKYFLWIYLFLTVFYSVLMIFNPDVDITIIDRIGGCFYVASMTAFALIFRKGYKDFKNIDYTLPLIDMLKNVAKRYRLRSRSFWELLIPILLLDIGLTLSFHNNSQPLLSLSKILSIQLFYIPVMTISGFIGYLKWRKKQKPLRDRALELIKELES